MAIQVGLRVLSLGCREFPDFGGWSVMSKPTWPILWVFPLPFI